VFRKAPADPIQVKRMQRVRRSPRPRQESMEEALSLHDTEKRSWIRRVPPEVWIFIFYFLVTVFLTWPIIIKFTSSIYGVPSDNLGALWQFWWMRNFSHFSTSYSQCPLIGFPFGARFFALPLEPIAFYFEHFLLLFFNEVVVYNLITLSNFVLSGITMYYLVRYLTGNRQVAFFGGFAFMISTNLAFNAMYFLNLAMMEWMPLYILMLLRFIKKPDRKGATFLFLSALLVAGTNIHYALFMGIFTAAFLFGRLVAKRVSLWRQAKRQGLTGKSSWGLNKKTFALSLFVLLVLILVITPFYYLPLSYLNPPGKWPTTTTPSQLRIEQYIEWNSASPIEYVLPSIENPALGGITRKLNVTRGSYSNSLYMGWALIVLAAIGIYFVIRRKYKNVDSIYEESETDLGNNTANASKSLTEENRYIGWGCILAAVVAFALSLKPYLHIASTKIPLPSSLLMIFVPWLRWYMRISIVIVLCLIILACFGLSRILDKLKGFYKEILLVSLTVIVAVEMLIVPPFRYVDLGKTPKVFERLATLPRNSAIAFYPMYETGLFITNTLMNFQREFQKPMLNGAPDNSDGEALRRTVFNPFNEATPGTLRRFNIDYLVYFKEQMAAEFGEKKAPALPPGLELVQDFKEKGGFRNANVFRITAPEAELVPLYLGDITIPRMSGAHDVLRLVGGDGIIKILNFSGKETRAALELPISNNTIEREVIIRTGDKTIWQSKMSVNDKVVAEIPDLTIPKKGLDLHIIVNGPAVRLPADEISLFGTQAATVALGELKIVQR
jgi:hypothetical protein